MEPFHTAKLKYRIRSDLDRYSPVWPPVDYEISNDRDPPSFGDGFIIGFLCSAVIWAGVAGLAALLNVSLFGG